MREGSWKCDQCNNINYSFRTKCNRQNCGAEKPSESQKSPSQEAEENAQVCFVIYLVPLNVCCVKIILFLFTCTPCISKVKPLDSHLYTLSTQFNILPLFVCLYFLKGYGRVFDNLNLSTVPVSTRTCLRRSRVVVQQLQSMGLKVSQVVFMLLRLSSYSIFMVCVVNLYSKLVSMVSLWIRFI